MLKRLKIWQKLALISAAFALVIPAVLYFVLSERFEERRAVELRQDGLRYVEAVLPIFTLVPQHRGTSSAFFGGDRSDAVRQRLEGLQGQINDAMVSLTLLDSELGGDFDSTASLAAIQGEWADLSSGLTTLTGEESWQRHTRLVADIEALMVRVADNSGLRADPSVENAYLASAISRSFPSVAEYLGQLRGRGAGYAARFQDLGLVPNVDARGELEFLLRSIEVGLQESETSIDVVRTNDPALANQIDQVFQNGPAQTRNYLSLARAEFLESQEVGVEPTAYFDQGTATIAPFFDAQAVMIDGLKVLQQDRLTAIGREIGLAVAVVLLAALLTLGLIVLISRSITSQVSNLNDLFTEINRGRFEVRSEVMSEDELGVMAGSLNTMLDNTLVLIQDREERDQIQRSIRRLLEQVSDVADGDLRKDLEVKEDLTGSIADSFNFMLEELRDIIGGVQATTTKVTGAANQLATESKELADGSRRQSEEIQSTAESVRTLSVSAQEVSADAERSSQVASQALASAQVGTEAVERTIGGMGKIRQRVQDTSKRIKRLGESSQQIGEIVELISDLADRTSLLALNASIQAAAAGEAGRSFAVVAKEVEQLADRSTESTKRISQLITNIQRETAEASAAMEDTTREVVEGSRLATDAGSALEQIGQVSAQLSSLADDIVQRARRQAEISDGVAQAIGNIDAISRQTSGGVEETVGGLGELVGMAQQLRDSVAAFKLPGGDVRSAA